MIIAEPVQNAGGCLVPPDGYWPGLRELADKYGIALVADEVITGFGRIGEWFASARFGAAPDLITLRQGHHVRVRADGRRAGLATRSPSRCTTTAGCCCTASRSAATRWRRRSRCATSRSSSARACSRTCASTRATSASCSRACTTRVPIVGDVRGAGYFWALELVRDADNGTLQRRGARAAAARLPRRPAARGGPDRPPGRPRRRRAAPRPAADLRPRASSTRWSRRPRRSSPTRPSASSSADVIHDAHGYWLPEAGGGRAGAPAAGGDIDADVVVHRRRLHRACGRPGSCASAARLRSWCWRPTSAGTGRAGATAASARRCGRTCRRCVERFGDERALAACEASSESVRAIGAWCESEGVDAWFTPQGLRDGVDRARPGRDARRDPRRRAARPRAARSTREAVRARCDSPRFRRGAVRPRRRDGPARAARARPAATADRARHGVYEHSRVRALRVNGPPRSSRRPRAARVRARRRRARRSTPPRAACGRCARASSVTSSHIVLTEPVPDVLEEIGWTGGECVTDARLLVHYFRTTRDGRIAFGWGGGRLALGARLDGRVEVDADVAATTHRAAGRRCSRRSRPARSRTRGAARSTSRRATCRRSAPRRRARPLRVRLHRQRRRPVTPRRPDPVRPRARRP